MTGIEFHGDALLVVVNINWVQMVQVVQIVQIAGRATRARSRVLNGLNLLNGFIACQIEADSVRHRQPG